MQSPHPGFMRRFLVRVFAGLLAGTAAFAANAQSFTQPKVILTGNWPAAIYAADVNGDGIPDILYIDAGATPSSSTTHVLLGNAKGNYTETAKLATAGNSIAFGDLTGSGHVDIGWISVAATTSGSTTRNTITVSVAPGNGDGTFATTKTQSLTDPLLAKPMEFHYLLAGRLHPAGPLDVVAGDINNNTVFDLQFPNLSTTASYQFLDPPGGVGPMFIADLNGDGANDLTINSVSTFTAQVLLANPTVGGFNNGTTSSPPQEFFGTSGIRSMLLKDVNGDGRLDLIAEGANGRIDVFAGNGDGTFQSTSIGGTGSLDGTTGNGGHLIATGDFNHDGLIDALTATPAGISTLLGNGTQYLGLKGIYNAGPGRETYAVADFNGDGDLDLAVDSPEGIAIIYGNADGSFQTSQAFPAGQPALSGALGAFTSSGSIDAVVSTGATQAQFLHGNGDGTFTYLGSPAAAAPTLPANGIAGLWSSVAIGDFNGDGKLDIAITADGGSSASNGGVLVPLSGSSAPLGITFQFGNGDGTFGPSAPLGFTIDPIGIPDLFYGVSTEADLLGNGTGSIANRGYAGANNFESGLIGQGVELVSGSHGLQPHNLVIAGHMRGATGPVDLISQDGGSLQLYQNDGLGNFRNLNNGNAVGDLAVDGSLTTPGSLVAPDVSSTFPGKSVALGFRAFPGSAVIADLDGDGNGDLIVAYDNLDANHQAPTAAAPNYIYIWFGSGSDKFLTSAKHPVNPVRLTPSRNFYQIAVADLNGDGIPDLILSDGYILSVQLGNGDGSFGSESHYLAGQGINTISVADINGDGKPDLVLANGGAVLSNPVANLEVLASNPDVNTGGVTVLLNHATPALTPITGATLTASPEPSQYGNPFSITAAFPPPVTNVVGPTGTVTFAIDGNALGSVIVVSNTATINVPSSVYSTLAVGSHALTATYSGDASYSAGNLTGTHVVSLIPTSISLILCVDPPGSNFPCGNPLESTPLISPITMYVGQSVDGVAVESAINLTGTITFYSGTSIFCTLNANLQAGSNICPTQSGFFPAGTSTVTVVYSGDSSHASSTSNPIVVTVLPDPTMATLTSSLNPSAFGQPVTFTTNVQGNFAVAAGQVTFFDGTTALNPAMLDATGTATFTTSSLAAGTHPIHVAFAASASFNSTNSNTVNQVVTSTLSTVQSVITLSSSIDPSAPGEPVTFTATVTAPGPFPVIPTGTVTFLDGTVIGTGTINASGIATFTTSSLASGSHAITASYPGSTGTEGTGPVPPPNPPEPPGAHLQPRLPASGGFRVLGPVPHATTVQTPNPALFALPAAPKPAILKSLPRATASTPTILPSTSAVLIQLVTSGLGAEVPGFDLTVAPVPVSVGVGSTALLLVGVRDASGFNQPVQLACTGLPSETTCTFVLSLIPAGGGSTSLQVMPAAPHDCGSTTPYFVGRVSGQSSGTLAAFAFPGLLAGGFVFTRFRRRRRIRAILLIVFGLCGLGASAAISGCGHCTDLGTKPGTYAFNVVATAQGGPISETQTQVISMTVTIP